MLFITREIIYFFICKLCEINVYALAFKLTKEVSNSNLLGAVRLGSDWIKTDIRIPNFYILSKYIVEKEYHSDGCFCKKNPFHDSIMWNNGRYCLAES